MRICLTTRARTVTERNLAVKFGFNKIDDIIECIFSNINNEFFIISFQYTHYNLSTQCRNALKGI